MDEKTYQITAQPTTDCLVISLGGRIDSANSTAAEAEILALREEHPEQSLQLDLSNLEYISSSGLRVLLKLQKHEPGGVKLVEVGDVVYNILETTGFNRIFDVRRKPREITIDGYEEMARGATGVVYRVDDDTILKLYSPGNPIIFAEEEQRKARTALIAGVPTAIPYEIVKCGSSYGVLFELVKAQTAAAVIMADTDENLPKWGRKLGNLLKEIHSREADTTQLRNMKDIYAAHINSLDGYITPQQKEQVLNTMAQIPDRTTMLHGDFHTRNVMLQDGEFLLIDMIDCGWGHPIFDLSMNAISSIEDPVNSHLFTGITEERIIPLWESIISTYFGFDTREQIDLAREIIVACTCPRFMCFPAIIPAQTEEWKRGMVARALAHLDKFPDAVQHLNELF